MDLQEVVWKGVGGFIWLSGYGLVLGSCEHGNQPPGSIKDTEQPSNY